MKTSKRILMLLICMVLVLSLFTTGCGGKEPEDSTADKTDTTADKDKSKDDEDKKEPEGKDETGSDSNDPITITCMFSDHPSQPYQEDTWVIPKVIKEKFNITMEMQAIPSSAYQEKRNAVIASGEIPDLIMGVPKLTADEYGKKGMFMNFMDYKDNMPNMIAALEELDFLKAQQPGEDEFYVIAGKVTTPGAVHLAAIALPLVRMDVLEDLELSTPKTYDEFYDMLKKLKEAYPDSYPWIDRCRLPFMVSTLSGGLGLNSRPAGDFGGWVVFDPEKEVYTDIMESENFKFFIEFMKKCHDEGLLDPNYATDTATEWESKLMSDKGFFMCDYFARPDMMTNIARSSGNDKFSLEAMLPPVVDGGEQKVFPNLGVGGGFNVVNAKTEHPGRITEMLDFWYYSEEGSLMTTSGIKDETFKITEGNAISRIYTDTIKSSLDFDAAYGVNYLSFPGLQPDFFGYDLFDETASEHYNQPWKLFEDNMLEPLPTVVFNSEESERYNEYATDLNDERLSVLNQFIMGERDISEWEKAIEELHSIGMADYLELVNSAYKRIYNE